MDEVKVISGGVEYQATYEVVGDTLLVLLPDGNRCETELRGLHVKQAALGHLRAYVKSVTSQ